MFYTITETARNILASGFIPTLFTGMFATSSLLTMAKNNAAKHKIERKGYIVNPDRRSITEKTISFVKDYFFLLVPFYNIKKSFKILLTKDEDYANERQALYLARERLVERKPKKPAEVTQAQENVQTQENTQTQGTAQTNTQTRTVTNTTNNTQTRVVTNASANTQTRNTAMQGSVRQQQPNANVGPFDGLSLEQLVDLKKHYERVYNNLAKKYVRKETEGASDLELTKIAKDGLEYKRLYNLINARIDELNNLLQGPQRRL